MTYSAVEFRAGESIFSQGDEGRSMYLIQEGRVEVLQELEGVEMQVAVLERGDFFGEMAILEKAPRTHSVRALSDAKMVELDGGGFLHMLGRNPEIAVRMIRKLGRRLARTEEMLYDTFASRVAPKLTGAGEVEAEAAAAPEGSPHLFDLTSGRDYRLPEKSEITIGRSDPANAITPDVDLTAIDAKLSTSRRHARLLLRDGTYYLAEEGTTNGTFVNGQRLRPEQPVAIASGDEVGFGAVRMRFLVD